MLKNKTSETIIKQIGVTSREYETLILLAHGHSNKEIADILNISIKTAKNHVSNLFKKIGLEDRTQAALFCIKYGIVNISDIELPGLLTPVKKFYIPNV